MFDLPKPDISFKESLLKTCNDEIIGIVTVQNHNLNFRKTLEYDNKFVGLDAYQKYKEKCQQPIILVIESPHVEEFKVHGVVDFISGLPTLSRPVNGVSGDNIRIHLLALLKTVSNILGDGLYPVIVMNAIQEQCSKGVDTCKFRTKTFIKLWPAKEAYLRDRLRMMNPKIIINACTAGDFYLNDGKKAYGSGNRNTFENHFIELLTSEFAYVPDSNSNDLKFLDSCNLSGLVMNVIHEMFINSETIIRKSTHPAAWSYRSPQLRTYNNNVTTFKNPVEEVSD